MINELVKMLSSHLLLLIYYPDIIRLSNWCFGSTLLLSLLCEMGLTHMRLKIHG